MYVCVRVCMCVCVWVCVCVCVRACRNRVTAGGRLCEVRRQIKDMCSCTDVAPSHQVFVGVSLTLDLPRSQVLSQRSAPLGEQNRTQLFEWRPRGYCVISLRNISFLNAIIIIERGTAVGGERERGGGGGR